jgi:hypothetical protein
MTEDTLTIVAEEIVETRFGEKVYIDSPYEAKQYIKYMPWSADDGPNTDELESDTEVPSFEFSEGFETHASWDSDEYKWALDAETFNEAIDFFKSVGFEVEIGDRVGAMQQTL